MAEDYGAPDFKYSLRWRPIPTLPRQIDFQWEEVLIEQNETKFDFIRLHSFYDTFEVRLGSKNRRGMSSAEAISLTVHRAPDSK
jgi:hypothetical protein